MRRIPLEVAQFRKEVCRSKHSKQAIHLGCRVEASESPVGDKHRLSKSLKPKLGV